MGMKTSLVGALALMIIASPAFANIPLRWAPVLRETLPEVRKGRAGEVSANMGRLILGGLDASRGMLVALSRAGVEDLEGLENLLRAPDLSARAEALGADTRELESLRRSLDVLAPAIRRLQARGLKPYSTARSRFVAALARALKEQAADSDRHARMVLAAPASPNGGKADFSALDALLESQRPYLDAPLLDALAKTKSELRHGAVLAQAVAVVGRPDPNAMRDALADLPRPQSALSRLRAALARAAKSLRP